MSRASRAGRSTARVRRREGYGVEPATMPTARATNELAKPRGCFFALGKGCFANCGSVLKRLERDFSRAALQTCSTRRCTRRYTSACGMPYGYEVRNLRCVYVLSVALRCLVAGRVGDGRLGGGDRTLVVVSRRCRGRSFDKGTVGGC